ncbi:hypothetical protein AbraIFM66950_004021, partial [Aspergillus brasiliensis]
MIKKKRRDAEESSKKEEYEVIKVVEDGEARILPTTTSAVHDPISGRLFLGALPSPFMVVCEKQ